MIYVPSKKIVWFDIDDVIFHLWEKLVLCYNQEYGTNKTIKDVWDLWDWNENKVYHVVEKYKLYENMEPTTLLPLLEQCKKDMLVLLITSRNERYRDITKEIFDIHKAPYDKLFMWEKKSEVCQQEGVDEFFDDSLYNIIDVKENAPKTDPHLVKRDWNGESEVIRLENQWIVCDRPIERLTEGEILKLFGG